MGLSSFLFDDIALGANQVVDPFELRPGESATIQNMVPGNGGTTFGRRLGLTLSHTLSALSTGLFANIYYWSAKGLIIVSLDGDIISMPDIVGSTATKRRDSVTPQNPLTTFTRWVFEIAKDGAGTEMLWAVSSTGSDSPVKWDGATATTTAWAIAPPSACKWIKLWKNRMVASGTTLNPERVYFSSIGNPELPNPYNFIDLRSTYDDSDPITWGELLGDNLIVFKPNSTWLIYDSNTFANRRLGYPGCIHEGLSAVLNGILYFYHRTGLWTCDGVTDPTLVRTKLPLTLSPTDIATRGSRLVADPVNQRLILTQAVGATGNLSNLGQQTGSVVTFIYPPRSKNNPRDEFTSWPTVFTPNLGPITPLSIATGGTQSPDFALFAAEYTGSKLYRLDVGNQDNVTDIVGFWQSGRVQLKEFEKLERIRRLNLRLSGANTLVTVSAPGATSFAANVLTADQDASGYARLRPEVRGREFQVRFDTVSSNTFSILDMELMLRGGKEHK